MGPLARYKQDCEAGYITHDPMQQPALLALQTLYQDLCDERARRKNLFSRWRKQKPLPGVYLWGGVGIGKTYLMDIFFDSLPGENKLRLHFHRFMQQVHDALRSWQGEAEPLQLIARQFAKQTTILCFDEFFVNDITDAMLLANLLDALFNEGITLVATSNVMPAKLYANGLQRNRFLPAIDLILKHTSVIHMPSETDYRLRTLREAGVFFTPLNNATEDALQACFAELSHHGHYSQTAIEINSRMIDTVAHASDVVWFDFTSICAVPRSQLDYLEIARQYPTVIISGVTPISALDEATITYFIHLIDIFYDNHVKLILSSDCPLDEIYTEGKKSFEFARTLSRLTEMQSQEYLRQAHIAA